jgi:hypothetical protein
MLAIEGAIDRVFPLRSAANGANIACDARTMPARGALPTEFARGLHVRIPLSYHRDMRRTDVYLKVELALDEKEQLERVAAELCRMVRRVHGVRSAEVSNTVDKDS